MDGMLGVIIGFVLGNAFCYFVLVRPIIKLKDEYIERIEKRNKR